MGRIGNGERIEILTKYYGVNILVSEACLKSGRKNQQSAIFLEADAHLSIADLPLRHLGRVQVKGKKEAIGIYECFAGDDPAIIGKKEATLEQFQEGLQYYFEKRFAQAAAVFEKILERSKEDATVRLFLNKSASYITNGAPEDWTDVERMEMK